MTCWYWCPDGWRGQRRDWWRLNVTGKAGSRSSREQAAGGSGRGGSDGGGTEPGGTEPAGTQRAGGVPGRGDGRGTFGQRSPLAGDSGQRRTRKAAAGGSQERDRRSATPGGGTARGRESYRGDRATGAEVPRRGGASDRRGGKPPSARPGIGGPRDARGRPGDTQGRPRDGQGQPGDRRGQPGDRRGQPGDRRGQPGDRQRPPRDGQGSWRDSPGEGGSRQPAGLGDRRPAVRKTRPDGGGRGPATSNERPGRRDQPQSDRYRPAGGAAGRSREGGYQRRDDGSADAATSGGDRYRPRRSPGGAPRNAGTGGDRTGSDRWSGPGSASRRPRRADVGDGGQDRGYRAGRPSRDGYPSARSREDRRRDDGSQGDRVRDDRPMGDRARGDRAQGGRYLGSRNQSGGDRNRNGRDRAGRDRTGRDRTGRGAWEHGDRERESIRLPALPASITADQLDPVARAEVRTLPSDLADSVARFLVAAGQAEDPERGYEYALAARHLAARVGIVRETCGIAAYRAEKWAEALADLRAARRLTAQGSYLPLMADCERALGRPDRALALVTGPQTQGLSRDTLIELRIVESGIRRDQGFPEAAVVALQVPELTDGRLRAGSARLFYAYADALVDAGRPDEARYWFGRAAAADGDGETDAAERADDLDQLSFDDMELAAADDADDADETGDDETGDDETGGDESAGAVLAPRQATTADLPAVHEVIEAAYARYADRMDTPPAPVLTDYRAAVEAGQVWVLGNPIAGVLVLVAGDDSLLVENVAVSPSAQGTGLGRMLMEFAEERAVGHGLRKLSLYTNEVMVENLAIYARLGYRETARGEQDGYRRVFLAKEVGG